MTGDIGTLVVYVSNDGLFKKATCRKKVFLRYRGSDVDNEASRPQI